MRAGSSEVSKSERVEKGAVTLPIDSGQGFKGVFSKCYALMTLESVYPLTIEIFGSGKIVKRSSYDVVDDLVWIRSTTLEILRISILTQSDVWLPYSLRAEPQHEICTRNADRLASALEEVKIRTGFKLEAGLETYYSVIKGFHLENIRYSDGSIADLS
jgi:hypothetical protein